MSSSIGHALTAETELLLHQFAYGCYQNGHFDKATRTFRLLAMLRASDERYWYGLASALMAWGKASDAIQPFQIFANCTWIDIRRYQVESHRE